MHSEFVYVLRAGSYYKIGRSNDVTKRIATLKIQLPFPVELFKVINTNDSVKLERQFHQTYAHLRVNGEWFKLSAHDTVMLMLYPCSVDFSNPQNANATFDSTLDLVTDIVQQRERDKALENLIEEESDLIRNSIPENMGGVPLADYLAYECPYDDLPFGSLDDIEWLVAGDNSEA